MEHGPPDLRPVDQETEERAATPAPLPSAGIDSGPAELVADLIDATGLVPADRLALVRGHTRQGGSVAEALVAEGLASSDGVARMLAARHRLPLVDLHLTGISSEASLLVPLHVLRRAVALPYRLDGETLHVALADPQNVHAIDELRLATRHQLSLGVAPRDDILGELDRMARMVNDLQWRYTVNEVKRTYSKDITRTTAMIFIATTPLPALAAVSSAAVTSGAMVKL